MVLTDSKRQKRRLWWPRNEKQLPGDADPCMSVSVCVGEIKMSLRVWPTMIQEKVEEDDEEDDEVKVVVLVAVMVSHREHWRSMV